MTEENISCKIEENSKEENNKKGSISNVIFEENNKVTINSPIELDSEAVNSGSHFCETEEDNSPKNDDVSENEVVIKPVQKKKLKKVKILMLSTFLLTIVLCLVCVVIIIVLLVVFWFFPIYQSDPECLKYTRSSNNVIVSKLNDNEYLFQPASLNSTTGFVFYPGGFVDQISYAPLLYHIVNRTNITCILLHSPYFLSILDELDGLKYINSERFENVDEWIVGGHSLGGVSSTRLTEEHPEKIKGLILLASYSENDISWFKGKVLTLYSENDKISTKSEIFERKKNLPVNSTYFIIRGGNHAQFGWYGKQSGDGEAKIDKYKQLDVIVNQTKFFLKKNFS